MECKICKSNKEILEFVKDKNCKSGFRSICKKCHYERGKNWIKSNAQKSKDIRRIWEEKNKEKNKSYKDKWKNENKELMKLSQKKYSDSERGRKWRSNYRKTKYETDFLYKITIIIRGSIKSSFSRTNFRKNSKTEKILGCSFEEFKNYIESKFESWMTWENYGKYNGEFNYGWDIDHIVPTSSGKTKEEIYKLNHYSNLQPLCSKINRDIKINKI
jgi:hypothetical protein